MNTFKQKLPFPLSFKIYKNTAFIALKKIIINQGIKSNFCYHFFSVIAIRLIILAARFQKQSNMFFLIFQILKFHLKKNILPGLWHISLTITICIPSPPCNRLLLFTKLIYDMARVGVKVGDEEFLPFYFVIKRGWNVEKFTIRSHFFLIIHVLLFKLLSYKEKNIKYLRIFFNSL